MLFGSLKHRITQKAKTFTSIADLFDSWEKQGVQASSGIAVSPLRAMQQATVYACIRILSECIAQLPIELHRIRNNRHYIVDTHPSLDVLYSPNGFQTAHEFMQFMVTHTELHGNAYCFKNMTGDGRVRELLPIRPNQVSIDLRGDWELTYNVTTAHGEISGTYYKDRILHCRNLSYDGMTGLSTIAYHRDTIGLAIQAETHGARVFKNGAQIGRVLQFPLPLKEAQRKEYEEYLRTREGAENAHRTLILDAGATVSSAQYMTNEDAQYLETRKYQKQELGAIFGVPMYLLNDTEKSTTWGTGLEELTKAFKAWTIGPRINRYSQTFARDFLTDRERRTHRYVFDTSQFNLGDFKDQMEGIAKGIDAGVLNPDEGRSYLKLNPRDGGDRYRHPMNFQFDDEVPEDAAP